MWAIGSKSMRLLPSERKPIGQWFPVHLHHGASEVGARIVLLKDGPIAPGDEAEVQLVLDRAIAAAAMDRYVVRDVSAQHTLGGASSSICGRPRASDVRRKGRRSVRRSRSSIQSRPLPRSRPRRLSSPTLPSLPATALF